MICAFLTSRVTCLSIAPIRRFARSRVKNWVTLGNWRRLASARKYPPLWTLSTHGPGSRMTYQIRLFCACRGCDRLARRHLPRLSRAPAGFDAESYETVSLLGSPCSSQEFR